MDKKNTETNFKPIPRFNAGYHFIASKRYLCCSR